MNKSRKSIWTAISAIALTFINGLFALVITKLVILQYGSDFNGLNSTANQFINMLLIVEGGFTIATNVALFKPMASDDRVAINRILSATKKTFNKIGIYFFIFGFGGSFIYSFIIISDLSPVISFSVLMMTIISTSFNLFFATKYRILLQSEHKEYILNLIQILTIIFSQFLILITIFTDSNMLLIRFSTMVGAIINSIIIAYITRKKYDYIDFEEEPDYDSIKGTKDIFIQKITSLIYSTVPILFIAGTVGTIFASVYVIYNNVFSLLKSVIYSFINAPRMGFGKIIAEKDSDYVQKVFLQYEFIVINVMFALLSTTSVLIMPFIALYSSGITDANYDNWIIALFFVGITFFEIIHIPSGNIINMAGKFSVGRKIQTTASIVIVTMMILGNYFLGFYGILFAVLSTAVLLAVLEILYIHQRYFKKAGFSFLRILVPNLIVMIICTLLEIKYIPDISSYSSFLIAGIIITILNTIILLVINYISNKEALMEIIERINIAITRR